MLTDFGMILLFFIIGALFVGVSLVAAAIIRPSRPNPIKNSTYECGEVPIKGAWVKFNVRFYVVALVFLIFDVEIVLLFPWALVYKQLSMGGSWFAYIAMLVFFVILTYGLIYDWAKGYMDWEKPRPYIPKLSDLVVRKKA